MEVAVLPLIDDALTHGLFGSSRVGRAVNLEGACGEGPFDASSQTIDVSPIILVFDPPSCPAPGIT
eukprot:CCRYP_008735-RB/>CCRYP_008735-RB protein AED:0.48 eAED:0.83 QI:0/0/0.33/1/0/0/3/0/65